MADIIMERELGVWEAILCMNTGKFSKIHLYILTTIILATTYLSNIIFNNSIFSNSLFLATIF